MNWKDITTYRREQKIRVPRVFECMFGRFRLHVHRDIRYPDYQWLATCSPNVFSRKELKSEDVEQAKCEAIALLQSELQKALDQITIETEM